MAGNSVAPHDRNIGIMSRSLPKQKVDCVLKRPAVRRLQGLCCAVKPLCCRECKPQRGAALAPSLRFTATWDPDCMFGIALPIITDQTAPKGIPATRRITPSLRLGHVQF